MRQLWAIFLFFVLTGVSSDGTTTGTFDCYLPAKQIQIPLDLALPPNYTAAPATPDSPMDVTYSVLWGTNDDIQSVYKDREYALKNLDAGLFSVRTAHSIFHEDSNGSGIGDKITLEHEKSGFQVLEPENLSWGPLPVFAARVITPKGTEIYSAWVDLRMNHQMLHIAFFPPKDDLAKARAKIVWNKFLYETKPLPRKDFLRLIGVEMEEGHSIFTRDGITMEGFCEMNADTGEIRVFLKPLVEDVDFEVYHIDQVHVEDFPTKCVKLTLAAVQKKESKVERAANFSMTLNPKPVVHFSLGGIVHEREGPVTVLVANEYQ